MVGMRDRNGVEIKCFIGVMLLLGTLSADVGNLGDGKDVLYRRILLSNAHQSREQRPGLILPVAEQIVPPEKLLCSRCRLGTAPREQMQFVRERKGRCPTKFDPVGRRTAHVQQNEYERQKANDGLPADCRGTTGEAGHVGSPNVHKLTDQNARFIGTHQHHLPGAP